MAAIIIILIYRSPPQGVLPVWPRVNPPKKGCQNSTKKNCQGSCRANKGLDYKEETKATCQNYRLVCQVFSQAWQGACSKEHNSQISSVPWMSIIRSWAEFNRAHWLLSGLNKMVKTMMMEGTKLIHQIRLRAQSLRQETPSLLVPDRNRPLVSGNVESLRNMLSNMYLKLTKSPLNLKYWINIENWSRWAPLLKIVIQNNLDLIPKKSAAFMILEMDSIQSSWQRKSIKDLAKLLYYQFSLSPIRVLSTSPLKVLLHCFSGKGPGSGLFPPGDVDIVGSLSPLQRMASITNSLVSQPPIPCSQASNRTNRASLPPITQQQFDRFSHLNTDEVVRRVS